MVVFTSSVVVRQLEMSESEVDLKHFLDPDVKNEVMFGKIKVAMPTKPVGEGHVLWKWLDIEQLLLQTGFPVTVDAIIVSLQTREKATRKLLSTTSLCSLIYLFVPF